MTDNKRNYYSDVYVFHQSYKSRFSVFDVFNPFIYFWQGSKICLMLKSFKQTLNFYDCKINFDVDGSVECKQTIQSRFKNLFIKFQEFMAMS